MILSKIYKLNVSLIFVMISIMISLLSACSKSQESYVPEENHLTIEELNTISDAYNNFFNSFNEGVVQLENSETVINDIENKRVPVLDGYTNVQIYDPQGNSPDGSSTIRNTVPYQRLMGHMDYYSYLEIIDGKGYLSSIIKIYNFNNPDPFRGILKVSKPLSEFFNANQYGYSYYLLDSTNSFVKSDDSAVELTKEEQDELSEQLKEISTLQEISGSIEITYQGKRTNFNYVIKNGFGVFS